MKALILAAGRGTRLMPLTRNIPKSLLRIDSRTIIDIELEALKDAGVREVILTTGHEEEKLQEHLAQYSKTFEFAFVQNELFDSTNYIYSMWLARDLIDDDMLLFHGDLLFDKSLLMRLVESGSENGVLINKTILAPEKDFKAVVNGDVVSEIGVHLRGEKAWFCAPMYKFSLDALKRWLEEIDGFVASGNVRCYAEDALNKILGGLELRALFYEEEFCMEIDTIEDLNLAQAQFDSS
jgi:phosphoenolpyruvate phosphomutase